MRKRQRTRDMIFRCRDFARDTGTEVTIQLVQLSPLDPSVRRRCSVTFRGTQVLRRQPLHANEVVVPIQEISSMADHWTQVSF